MEMLYKVRKTRLGADCGTDHELLIASEGALFLPPSDVYVRSFLYLFIL